VEQVRTALKELSNDSYQVIFTTHSAVMVAADDIPNTLLIRKTQERGTHSRLRLADAVQQVIKDAPSQARMLFSLGNASQILFADRVLLVEGDTERELLPDVFEKITGHSLSFHRIALIPQGGKSNTAKSLRILAAMGVPARALVDLDYACKAAVQDGFITRDDADLLACKKHFERLLPDNGFRLSEDGLPCKGGTLRPEEAYEVLAADNAAAENIGRLHERLQVQHIWLWTKGAVERHLGLESKEASEWSEFRRRIRTAESYDDVVADSLGLRAFVDWLLA